MEAGNQVAFGHSYISQNGQHMEDLAAHCLAFEIWDGREKRLHYQKRWQRVGEEERRNKQRKGFQETARPS